MSVMGISQAAECTDSMLNCREIVKKQHDYWNNVILFTVFMNITSLHRIRSAKCGNRYRCNCLLVCPCVCLLCCGINFYKNRLRSCSL